MVATKRPRLLLWRPGPTVYDAEVIGRLPEEDAGAYPRRRPRGCFLASWPVQVAYREYPFGWSLPNLATGAGFRRGYALRTNDAPRKRASHAAFRPGQLGPVKAKFLADAAHNAGVKDLARSAERHFRLP